ncbi:MAG TPA: (5-formylfuran-3-yl)methyl phosphate synthase [Gemmatimonadales bacterium]
MPLLVSVRSAEEVSAALAGGADIIDAKEPARGSLGAVDREVLLAIAARTPRSVPLSVALGDCATEAETRRAVSGARLPGRSAPVYLKLGLAGTLSVKRVLSLLRSAVDTAAEDDPAPAIVAVAYADHRVPRMPPPEEVLRATSMARASGLLIDTFRKDGGGLLDHLSLERLSALSLRARSAGLLFALAGSLDSDAIARVAPLADVVGVRGAACQGGRDGTVSAERVAGLRHRAFARPLLAGARVSAPSPPIQAGNRRTR